MTQLSHDELERMLERAAEDGARKALAAVGLEDASAGADVRDLRSLLSAWRDAKKTAWRTTIQSLTKLALMIIAAGMAWHWWGR
jgi:enoyl-CoA hydratase/carnithine racemase